mgnify:CR=1 FL=1|tara:strand:+ start:646 stop:1317 length:672 start_codon:yes stop_codon:yes gene_type:complete
MSSYVDREWFYYLRGRELLLYKLLGGSSNDRISQNGVLRTRGKELMYPDEDIASGLRVEYTALNEPFVSEALETTTVVASGTDIHFADTNVITGAGTSDGFAATDKIRVQGSASNDGDYTLTNAISSKLTTSVSITDESAGERITITQIPKEDSSPSSTSHVNLNKMLSLAVVDYLKAMNFEMAGDIERKEYYMKEFYGKLGDNESNKRNISVSFPSGPFAIR